MTRKGRSGLKIVDGYIQYVTLSLFLRITCTYSVSGSCSVVCLLKILESSKSIFIRSPTTETSVLLKKSLTCLIVLLVACCNYPNSAVLILYLTHTMCKKQSSSAISHVHVGIFTTPHIRKQTYIPHCHWKDWRWSSCSVRLSSAPTGWSGC